MLHTGFTMRAQPVFALESSLRTRSVGGTCSSATDLRGRLDVAMKVTVEQVSLAARDAFATGRAAHRPDVATIQALRARLQIARLRVEVLHHLLAAAEAALASVDLRYEDPASSHAVDAPPDRAIAELADRESGMATITPEHEQMERERRA